MVMVWLKRRATSQTHWYKETSLNLWVPVLKHVAFSPTRRHT